MTSNRATVYCCSRLKGFARTCMFRLFFICVCFLPAILYGCHTDNLANTGLILGMSQCDNNTTTTTATFDCTWHTKAVCLTPFVSAHSPSPPIPQRQENYLMFFPCRYKNYNKKLSWVDTPSALYTHSQGAIPFLCVFACASVLWAPSPQKYLRWVNILSGYRLPGWSGWSV